MFKGWKFVALMFAFRLPMALANAPALFAQSSAKVQSSSFRSAATTRRV